MRKTVSSIAQANTPLNGTWTMLTRSRLFEVKGGEVEYVNPDDVDYMDVSPRQMWSVATSHDSVSWSTTTPTAR